MGSGKKEVEQLISLWQAFAQREGSFVLNPDAERVLLLAKGVLSNEKNYGLKYCPCRMTTGRRAEDLKLICPCNFKVQKTWMEKRECWCSLFLEKR